MPLFIRQIFKMRFSVTLETLSVPHVNRRMRDAFSELAGMIVFLLDCHGELLQMGLSQRQQISIGCCGACSSICALLSHRQYLASSIPLEDGGSPPL